jgi:streptomycin 6-kinase
VFSHWLERWSLTADGAPIATRYSDLLPVNSPHGPAMLKLPRAAHEHGAESLAAWRGAGAVRVYELDDKAHLMERAVGTRRLIDCSDDDATRIICRVANTLHSAVVEAPPSAVPLEQWMRALSHPAALAVARELLDSQDDVVLLHGDLHHENVLDGGAERGWLAIDAKGLVGERTFDFLNILFNPSAEVALAPGRLGRQMRIIAEEAGLDLARLRLWAFVFGHLSAAWCVEDGDDPSLALAIADVCR